MIINPNVAEVDVAIVYENLKKDIVLIDVRTPEEYSRGHIEGSINIPLPDISKAEEKFGKDKTIYLYCLSGSRSSVAIVQMQKMGFKNAYSMKSGLLSWRANKYPIVQ